jgi:very-short-patch-repair endonuclease
VRTRGRVAAVLLDRTESLPEQLFLRRCLLAGLPRPQLQVRAVEGRRWRWDFGWADQRLLVEIQGGQWTNGRHVRGLGYENDLRKANAAVEQGYRVLAFTPGMVESGEAVEVVRRVLEEV